MMVVITQIIPIVNLECKILSERYRMIVKRIPSTRSRDEYINMNRFSCCLYSSKIFLYLLIVQ